MIKRSNSVALRRCVSALVALVFLQAFNESKSNSAKISSSGGGTVSPSGKDSLPTRSNYVDSGGFIPDGYYIIDTALTPDHRKIGSLELITVERVDSAGNMRDRPILLHPAVGFLTVSEPNSENGSRYPCTIDVIARDSLSGRCSATPIGDVAFNGHFFDSGDYSDKFAETSTVLLATRVVISKSGQILHDGLHRLTYNSGD